MALLVEEGADVNELDKDEHNVVPRLPVQLAAMAGAVERVRWLLEHGADPESRAGFYQSAAEVARSFGTVDMKRVMDEWTRLKRGTS